MILKQCREAQARYYNTFDRSLLELLESGPTSSITKPLEDVIVQQTVSKARPRSLFNSRSKTISRLILACMFLFGIYYNVITSTILSSASARLRVDVTSRIQMLHDIRREYVRSAAKLD